MKTYTAIGNTALDIDSPIRSSDVLKLRDNPIAMAEGAAGAPRIQDAALDGTVTAEGSEWVRDRIGATAADDVGSYAQAMTSSIIPWGTLVAGNLLKTGFDDFCSLAGGLGGTWRSMTYHPVRVDCISSGGGVEDYYAGLFLKVS